MPACRYLGHVFRSDPLAYFLTWTTYGTWLSGDECGWVDGASHEMHFEADPERERQARERMKEAPVILDPRQRVLVKDTIVRHCAIRRWELHAVNVRTNHVHVVVALADGPDRALREFKAWGTRRLKEASPGRSRWWRTAT